MAASSSAGGEDLSAATRLAASSSAGVVDLSDATRVAELKRFIRRRCYPTIRDIALKKLIAAAVTTLVRRKAINGFRSCCFILKEGHGSLYDLVKELAPPPPTAHESLNSNPFADFKRDHPLLQLPEELDFLLEGYEERTNCTLNFDLGLSDEQCSEVRNALSTKRIPEWLMKPCPFLTFEENLDMRVQIVRLWIVASKLPLYVGSRITFDQLHGMDHPLKEPKDCSREEDLPSKFEVRIRETTLEGYYWSKSLGWTVEHPSPSDLPQNCCRFNRCYAKVRYPVRIHSNGFPSYTITTGNREVDDLEFEERMQDDLLDMQSSETPLMYQTLTRLIYSLQ